MHNLKNKPNKDVLSQKTIELDISDGTKEKLKELSVLNSQKESEPISFFDDAKNY